MARSLMCMAGARSLTDYRHIKETGESSGSPVFFRMVFDLQHWTVSMKDMVNEIYDRYYPEAENRELRELLKVHSECVARKALELARQSRFAADIDMEFVRNAALLHDIGIIRTSASGIWCFGTLPYICHGVEGRKMLMESGLPERYGLVCERHTGAGLTVADIERQQLPLPLRDMCPVTLEEKLVCYADKFFSKSGTPEVEKPFDRVVASMARHGEETLRRFMDMHELLTR